MNARQKRFCDEYLIDCNALQAAIRAGYSPKTSKNATYWINDEANKKQEKLGRKSVYRPELREYIDSQLEQMHNKKTADAQEVLEYLTSVMRGEHKDETLALAGEGFQEIIEIGVPEKDRLKAAELIGKRYGMFTDKATLDVNIPTIIDGENDLED